MEGMLCCLHCCVLRFYSTPSFGHQQQKVLFARVVTRIYVKRKQRMHFFENRKLIKLTPRIGVWDCIISCRNREYNIMMNMSLNLKPFIKETTNGNDIAGFATFYIVFLFL